MTTLRHHFSALLTKVNPDEDRLELAKTLPGEVRDWLKDNDFETRTPHSRLIGSYARGTAICNIKDVDVLLFVPKEQLDRTPNALLRELKGVLDDYPDTTAEVSGQRRSVHLEFPAHEVQLDIVPAVLEDSLEDPVQIPDRPAEEWILSDPLGYGRRLSDLNKEHSRKVVPLIKLIKAWRNVQMKRRRPKSYVLEVMILYAVEEGKLAVAGQSWAQCVTSFFQHIRTKYRKLMDSGTEAPRIPDPQIPEHFITRGWERDHFETFMRRIRESARRAERALEADDEEEASELWQKIFGELWPNEEEVKSAARAEAAQVVPGVTVVSSTGGVLSTSGGGVTSHPTRFHGGNKTTTSG